MPKRRLSVALVALTLLASPASAGGLTDTLSDSVSGWIAWGKEKVAAVPVSAPDVSGMIDQAIVLAKSYGPGFPTLETDARAEEGWSDTVRQSIGCVIGGTAGTASALIAGGENLVNIIAGGVVTPANPFVLYTGLFGVVFASFCAVGQALTPLYIHFVDPPPPGPPAGSPPALVGPGLPNPHFDARVFFIAAPGPRP